jgi:Fe-S-cluster-containing dehydrogenase component
VKICPTTALFKREDGIVDFDSDRCIGCKVCLNTCPYDARYIDPSSHTAAKCNFCAHRVELDLRPSCEVVCPVGAIVSGDLDDLGSEVSRLLGAAVGRPSPHEFHRLVDWSPADTWGPNPGRRG